VICFRDEWPVDPDIQLPALFTLVLIVLPTDDSQAELTWAASSQRDSRQGVKQAMKNCEGEKFWMEGARIFFATAPALFQFALHPTYWGHMPFLPSSCML